jgi:hypothetical protein
MTPSKVQREAHKTTQILDRELHPKSDEELLFYRKYEIAKLVCHEGYIHCPLCMKEDGTYHPHYIKCSEVITLPNCILLCSLFLRKLAASLLSNE